MDGLLRKTGTRSWVAARAFAVTLLSALAGGAAAQGGPDIKIGSVMPLAGDQAAVAKLYADGYRAYFGAINEAGGVNGRKINWLIEDDGMQAARSISGIRKLVQQDRVVLLTGTYGTGNTLQVLPVVEQLNIPLVAPIGYAVPLYRPIKPMVFAVFPGFLDIYPLVASHMKASGSKKFAILYRKDPAGEESVQGFSKALDKSEVTLALGFDLNITDFTTIALRVVAENPDTVLIYGALGEVAKAIDALRSQGFTGRIADTLSTADATILKLTRPGLKLENIFGIALQDLSGQAPGWKRYTESLAKFSPGANPESGFTLTGYINAAVVVEVLRKAGNDLTPEGIKKGAESVTDVDTGGLTGKISFSPTKHLGTDEAIVTDIRDGKIVPATSFMKIPAAQ